MWNWICSFFESKKQREERLLHEAIHLEDSSETGRLLRDAPEAAPSQLNRERNTALHRAAISGRPEAADAIWQILSDTARKQILSAKNASGQTALHCAVQWTRVGMVDWLLRHGADPNAVNNDGQTPVVSFVITGRQLAQTSLEHSVSSANDADRNKLDGIWLGFADQIVRLLANSNADLNIGRPASPLRWAAISKQEELAQILRKYGAVK